MAVRTQFPYARPCPRRLHATCLSRLSLWPAARGCRRAGVSATRLMSGVGEGETREKNSAPHRGLARVGRASHGGRALQTVLLLWLRRLPAPATRRWRGHAAARSVGTQRNRVLSAPPLAALLPSHFAGPSHFALPRLDPRTCSLALHCTGPVPGVGRRWSLGSCCWTARLRQPASSVVSSCCERRLGGQVVDGSIS